MFCSIPVVAFLLIFKKKRKPIDYKTPCNNLTVNTNSGLIYFLFFAHLDYITVNKQLASTDMYIYFFILLSDIRTARQIFKHRQAYSTVSIQALQILIFAMFEIVTSV